jgi:16S rRNA (uracil1498-N3)-methyltransferase
MPRHRSDHSGGESDEGVAIVTRFPEPRQNVKPHAMEQDNDHIAARLFVTAPLVAGAAVPLDSDQTHYLRSVLRLGPGDTLALFDGKAGEWRAVIETLGKHAGVARLERQTRPQPVEAELWLLFAPVKRTRIDLIAEKATELGTTRLMPVITRRTNVARVNTDRLRAVAREAAEQTERLSVPEIVEPQRLDQALAAFPADRHLILCDESGTAPPIAQALAQGSAPLGVLIGPEGGFAPEELDELRKLAFVTPVGLGPRILRADTAAFSALAIVQALAGDWDGNRPR